MNPSRLTLYTEPIYTDMKLCVFTKSLIFNKLSTKRFDNSPARFYERKPEMYDLRYFQAFLFSIPGNLIKKRLNQNGESGLKLLRHSISIRKPALPAFFTFFYFFLLDNPATSCAELFKITEPINFELRIRPIYLKLEGASLRAKFILQRLHSGICALLKHHKFLLDSFKRAVHPAPNFFIYVTEVYRIGPII